ncbi:MAG: activator of Hsp90 ATPase 1 family protein [Verrucomicrobiaceae bacterium]|nr:activator of Hsp90 ATPase 1 family protein [Verrucomicrobiaceae bacterium]
MTAAPTATDASDTLSIIRQFKAKRDRVFAAFTTFETMAEWFGPPGCNVKGGSVDFRIGGAYQMRITMPDGEAVVGGQYREIAPPDRLVFTWKWEDDEDWTNLESVVTLEFLDKGDETELRLTQTGFPSSESCGRHQFGWSGCFEKLEVLFAA